MTSSDVVLERETANDEEAQVVAVHVPSGTAVLPGDVIFDIENSKATQEVVAPRAGILIHDLEIGRNVAFGVPIARIVSDGDDAAAIQGIRNATAPEGEPPRSAQLRREPTGGAVIPERSVADVFSYTTQRPGSGPDEISHPVGVVAPRFSHAAAALIANSGLTGPVFNTDFVTTRDVLGYLKRDGRGVTGEAGPAPSPQPVIPKAGTLVVGRKRAEIEALSTGAGGTMLSVLGTSLGILAIPRNPGHFLAGRITDLVVYEASRLMRKFPRLNAFYQDGGVVEHDAVHAGLAIDGGGRLMVYGIENADRMGLPDLADVIEEAVSRYAANSLTAAELSRATFTVTDLSADELDFVLPLLPRGQSSIIGVTQSNATGFRLFVGFDHRVTEGREVAAFLGELRDRVMSFADGARRDADKMLAKTAHCDYCGRSLADAVRKGKEKGLLKILDAEHRDALCCASCWNGW